LKKTVLLCFLFLLLCSPVHAAGDVQIIVATSPASPFYSHLSIQDKHGLAASITQSPTIPSKQLPELPRATIRIGEKEYVYDSFSRMYETGQKKQVLLPVKVQTELEKRISQVEKAHFGEPLDWESVRKAFKRMAYADVIDLETGAAFRVQRRAGSRHADVQPLTKQDTKIMKQVYQGKWSWKRRAVLVAIDGKKYAASMNGMPHGAGAIAGNNFRGHFCIHFKGSTLHRRRSNTPDPGHSLMVLKASGALRQTVIQADPQQLVDIFLTSLQEQDRSTLDMTTNGFPLPFSFKDMHSVKKSGLSNQTAGLFTAVVPVNISYILGKDKKNGVWVFLLNRSTPLDRWKITSLKIDSPSRR
jgi:hypothetical protein